MGRVKLQIKKLEKYANRQVTYAKRRNGLIKKAHELSLLCDIDVAVIAFSPSGKLTQFCTDDKIEEVIARYINTPQHERTKAKFENMEHLNKIVQKLRDERALEAPRVSYTDLQLEIQQLRSLVKKTAFEKNVFEQEARLIVSTDGYIKSCKSLAEAFYTRSQLVKSLEKIEERLQQLERQQSPGVSQNTVQQTSFESGLLARDGSNVGSIADSAQAMFMNNWTEVHSLASTTSVMANSQVMDSAQAMLMNNWGEVHNLASTTSVMADSQVISSAEVIDMSNWLGVHNLNNTTSIMANSQMTGQVHGGDTDYLRYGCSLHNQPQGVSPTLEPSSSWVEHDVGNELDKLNEVGCWRWCPYSSHI